MSALRNIRERKGFNISQLASRSGISGKVLLEYEEGRQVIPLAHAKLLAKALWVEIDELMPAPGSVIASPPAQTTPQAPRPSQQPPARPVSPVQITVSQSAPVAASPTYSPAPPPSLQSPEGRMQHAPHNGQGHGAKPEGRSPKAPKVIPPVTEGQIQELLQLAHRLDISQDQLEERVGKSMTALMKPEATEWVKRLKAIADEIAPASKIRYGRWPDANEDREAAYLAKQRDAGALCLFHLFNGEEFSGTLLDFTPYTITIQSVGSQEEVVLRKLAIAYYRCTPTGNLEASGASSDVPPQPSEAKETETRPHDHKRDDRHQPLDKGIDSDRAGQPEKPEKDKMDEDRGL